MYFIGSYNWKSTRDNGFKYWSIQRLKLHHQDLISVSFCANFSLSPRESTCVLTCSLWLSHSNSQTFSRSSLPHLREKGPELVALKGNESVKNTSNSCLRVRVLQNFKVLFLMLFVCNCILFCNLNLLIFLFKLLNDIEIIGYLNFLL